MIGSSRASHLAHPNSKWRARLQVGAWLLVGLLVLSLALKAAASKGFYWADDYAHLDLSRAALLHPSILIDVWARPVMTLVYIPAAHVGEWAVRATSLVLFGLTAIMCWLTARRDGLPASPMAAVFLLVQPAAAELAYAALPGTVFSFLLALALWLRAARRESLAALVVSALPAARFEGVAVIAVWALVMAWQRRWRVLPLLAVGLVIWDGVGLVLYHDPLFLIHDVPQGFTTFGTTGAAGIGYILVAYPAAVGPIVGALAFAALAYLPRFKDPLPPALCATTLMVLAIIWQTSTGTAGIAIYVVAASVPLALLAAHCTASLIDPWVRPWLPGEAVALVLALGLAAARPLPKSTVLIVLLVAATIAFGRLKSRWSSQAAMAGVGGGLLVVAAATGFILTKPLPITAEAEASRQLRDEVAALGVHVSVSNRPEFTWFDRTDSTPIGLNFRTRIDQAPAGTWVVWDSESSPPRVTAEEIRALGYVEVSERDTADRRIVLLQRR